MNKQLPCLPRQRNLVDHKQSPRIRNRQIAEEQCVNVAQISIPLKPQDKPVEFPPDFYDTLKKEYASKYLNRIGAKCTSENIATVLSHFPLTKSKVTAAWKSRGCLSDVLYVDPFKSINELKPNIPIIEAQNSLDTVIPKLTNSDPTDDEHSFGTDQLKLYRVGQVVQSFDDMKRKYLYPFNCQNYDGGKKISTKCQRHHRMSVDNRTYRPSEAAVMELWNSVDITYNEIKQMQFEFCQVIPYDMLFTKNLDMEKEVLCEQLTSYSLQILIGFLGHFVYQKTILKLAIRYSDISLANKYCTKKVLSEEDMNTLYMTISTTFNKIKKVVVGLKKGISLVLPLVLMSLRVTIESIFRNQFPKWFDDSSTRIEATLGEINSLIDKLLDPEQSYGHIGVFESTSEAIRMVSSQKHHFKKKFLRRKFFVTSPALHTIFPEPISGANNLILKKRGGARLSQNPGSLKNSYEPVGVSISERLQLMNDLH